MSPPQAVSFREAVRRQMTTARMLIMTAAQKGGAYPKYSKSHEWLWTDEATVMSGGIVAMCMPMT